jgi:8-oxo-dGTP diphosphatase
VREETGLVCEAGPHLLEVVYADRKRRSKRVRYWAMRPVDGEFRQNDEVDGIRWVRIEDAASRLTYDHDLPLLARILELLPVA